jgi:hypothetical protein
MKKRIICATDFSPAAEQGAELALPRARLFGDRMELRHWTPGSPFIHPETVVSARAADGIA